MISSLRLDNVHNHLESQKMKHLRWKNEIQANRGGEKKTKTCKKGNKQQRIFVVHEKVSAQIEKNCVYSKATHQRPN